MLKLLLICFFMLLTMVGLAQVSVPMFQFKGQILDTDSIPVEHAYLVNYRTLRAYATDRNGRFKIPCYTGDSLKLVHVSYQSKIIKVSPIDTTILVDYDENMLGSVTVKSVDLELQYFNKNWENMSLQIGQMSHYNYKNTKVQNPYDANQFTGTTGIRISDIIDLFKKRK